MLKDKLKLFKNNFILITHNSDEIVSENEISETILNNQKLIKWYSQNVCYKHKKLESLPIGMANSMWQQGDVGYFELLGIENMKNLHLYKTEKIYFNFAINTNINKRQPCYNAIINNVRFLENTHPRMNLERLAKYEFCI